MVLIFSPGTPILYAFIFLFLLITYWMDKYFLLNFYKIPPQYDLVLSKAFNYIIALGALLHLCFAIFTFGNPDYFSKGHDSLSFLNKFNSVLDNLSIFNSRIGQAIKNRLKVSHNLVLLIILILFVAFVLIRLIFYDLIKLIFSCCSEYEEPDIEEEDLKIQSALSLSDLYKTYQIRKLQCRKLFDESDLDKNTFLKNYYINSIALDRYYLVDKLEKEESIYVNKESLNSNFDKNIKTYFKDKVYIQSEMKGDSSYNIAFRMEYEYYAFHNLIHGSKANKKLNTERYKIKKIISNEDAKITDNTNNENEPNSEKKKLNEIHIPVDSIQTTPGVKTPNHNKDKKSLITNFSNQYNDSNKALKKEENSHLNTNFINSNSETNLELLKSNKNDIGKQNKMEETKHNKKNSDIKDNKEIKPFQMNQNDIKINKMENQESEISKFVDIQDCKVVDEI